MKKLSKKNLDDLSKSMPIISEIEQKEYVGGVGIVEYSFTQYQAMEANHTWQGGYVTGWGYLTQTAYIYGTTGNYTTLGAYKANANTSTADFFVTTAVGAFGGTLSGVFMGIVGFWESNHTNMQNDLIYNLSQFGYNDNSQIYVGRVDEPNDNRMRINIYDSTNGMLITGGYLTPTGYSLDPVPDPVP